GVPGTISLRGALEAGLNGYLAQGIAVASPAEVIAALTDFIAQRLRFLLEEQGHRFDTARAVLASGFDALNEAWRRAEALTSLRGPQHELDFLSLATSAKRIRNILAQARQKGIALGNGQVEPALLADAEEKELHSAVGLVGSKVEKTMAAQDP